VRRSEMSIIKGSFKRQIFVIFSTVTLILVIIGGILTMQGFQARIIMDHELQDEEQEKLINERLSSFFYDAEVVLLKLSTNEEIRKELSKIRPDMSIYTQLYDISAGIRDYCSIDVYIGGECRFSTRQGGMSAPLPENYSILLATREAAGKSVYGMDPVNASGEGSALLIARKVANIKKDAYVIVRIEKEALENRLGGLLNARDGFILANSFLRPYCMLGTAEDGHVLASVRKNLFAGEKYTNNIKSNVYISELGDRGLLGIYITMPAFEESAVGTGYRIVLFQVIISIILCLIVASRMSNLFSKPINTLSIAMKRFRKGDFDTKIELDREDEFGQLASGFNKMTSQLKANMQERVDAERRVNEARIEMMQAQLNPHFLYNTLDTIKWVAKANQVPEIATLSASLASILRSSISESRFVTLKQECELVESYCEIQKIRFDDSFDLTVDVPVKLRDVIVPKLILQPMVENSIIHGLEGRRDGHIVICAKAEENAHGDGDDLILTITDNGAGISDEMIEALKEDDPEKLSGHLGLNNVNTIIRLYYGKDYGVSAQRPEEGGTVMALRIPILTNEPVKEQEET